MANEDILVFADRMPPAPAQYSQSAENQFRRLIELARVPQLPPQAHAASHGPGGSDPIDVTGYPGLLSAAQKVKVTGASYGPTLRTQMKFLAGSNITLSFADDNVNDVTSITINASGGVVGGSGTAGKIAKWTAVGTIGDSILSESGSVVTISGALTTTGLVTTPASAAGGAGLNLPHGAAPTTPVNGDVWTTTAGMFVRVNGATQGPLGVGGPTGSGTTNTIAKWTAGSALGNSNLTDDGTDLITSSVPWRARGSFTADSGNYRLATIIISASAPSGTAPIGCLWAKF